MPLNKQTKLNHFGFFHELWQQGLQLEQSSMLFRLQAEDLVQSLVEDLQWHSLPTLSKSGCIYHFLNFFRGPLSYISVLVTLATSLIIFCFISSILILFSV